MDKITPIDQPLETSAVSVNVDGIIEVSKTTTVTTLHTQDELIAERDALQQVIIKHTAPMQSRIDEIDALLAQIK